MEGAKKTLNKSLVVIMCFDCLFVQQSDSLKFVPSNECPTISLLKECATSNVTRDDEYRCKIGE